MPFGDNLSHEYFSHQHNSLEINNKKKTTKFVFQAIAELLQVIYTFEFECVCIWLRHKFMPLKYLDSVLAHFIFIWIYVRLFFFFFVSYSFHLCCFHSTLIMYFGLNFIVDCSEHVTPQPKLRDKLSSRRRLMERAHSARTFVWQRMLVHLCSRRYILLYVHIRWCVKIFVLCAVNLLVTSFDDWWILF